MAGSSLSWMGRAGFSPGHCLPPEMTAHDGFKLPWVSMAGGTLSSFALGSASDLEPRQQPPGLGPQHPTRDSLFCLTWVSSGGPGASLSSMCHWEDSQSSEKPLYSWLCVRVSSWGRMCRLKSAKIRGMEVWSRREQVQAPRQGPLVRQGLAVPSQEQGQGQTLLGNRQGNLPFIWAPGDSSCNFISSVAQSRGSLSNFWWYSG